jgi:hypothetical protein
MEATNTTGETFLATQIRRGDRITESPEAPELTGIVTSVETVFSEDARLMFVVCDFGRTSGYVRCLAPVRIISL